MPDVTFLPDGSVEIGMDAIRRIAREQQLQFRARAAEAADAVRLGPLDGLVKALGDCNDSRLWEIHRRMHGSIESLRKDIADAREILDDLE